MEDSEAKNLLTRKDAVIRETLIKKGEDDLVLYDMILTLRSKSDSSASDVKYSYEGIVNIGFNYYKSEAEDENLFLNFCGFPLKLIVNGKEEFLKYEKNKIYLKSEFLLSNQNNNITIFFAGQYSNQGVGIVHYSDSIDSKEYIYTQFEPFDCNRLFPCFDQPNIKSKLKLKLITPQPWKVFANETEDNNEEITDNYKGIDEDFINFLITSNGLQKKNYKITTFKQTPKISCYLFAVCAGNYHIYENTYKPDYKVKMRVIVRDSLKIYTNPEEMIKVTIEGIEFYESYFGIDYPFNKYDQIFCPEYNFGAMENVGLVTFNECYLFKSTPTLRSKISFFITVLHELAHMWFGNLVTMNWWDDLWLNEAFATFISHLALDYTIKDSNISWLLFNYYKGFAYRDDQLPTSHSVMDEVENTLVTETNFDSITYEKGSSIVKQLYYVVGHSKFGEALNKYFNQFKYKNTVYDDFIEKMEEVCSGISLMANSWLKTTGLTSICPAQIIEEKKLKKIVVTQEPCRSEFNTLQTLVGEILLIYKPEGGALVYKAIENVKINPNKETVLQVDLEIPQAIMLNYNDWSYTKVILDHESFKFFKENLNLIEDQLLRQMIYRSLYDMVRDVRISGVEYVDILIGLLCEEKNEDIISSQLRYISTTIYNYIPRSLSKDYNSKVFKLLIQLFYKFQDKNEMVLTILDKISGVAESKGDIDVLILWLTSSEKEVINFIYDKLEISFKSSLLGDERKMEIIKRFYPTSYYDKTYKDELLEKVLSTCESVEEKNNIKLFCLGADSSIENKEKIWKRIVLNPDNESLYVIQNLMDGFATSSQSELVKEYLTERFFNELEYVDRNNTHFYTEAYIQRLSPSYFPSLDAIEKLEKYAEILKNSESSKKELLQISDHMKTQLKAYELCIQYLNSKY